MISAKYTSFHMTKQQIDTDLSDNYSKNIAIRWNASLKAQERERKPTGQPSETS